MATGATAARFNPALNTLLRAQADPADRQAAVKALAELCGALTDADLRPQPVAQDVRAESGGDRHMPSTARTGAGQHPAIARREATASQIQGLWENRRLDGGTGPAA